MSSLERSPALRRILLFGPALVVAVVNLAHPLTRSDAYGAIAPHVQWWITLHAINLLAFPFMGLSAYLLIRRQDGWPVTLGVVALAIYAPAYAGFDALAGMGTGVLIASTAAAGQGFNAAPLVTAYFNSPVIYALAAIGSIAWTIAMLASVLAFTPAGRPRTTAAVVALVAFAAQGWARGTLFSPDGLPTTAWWGVAIASIIAMSLAARPRIVAALLTAAATLFGAMHTPPTGPLGALCFVAAAALIEFRYADRAAIAEPAPR